jgi:hypothetical protein
MFTQVLPPIGPLFRWGGNLAWIPFETDAKIQKGKDLGKGKNEAEADPFAAISLIL